MEHSIKLEKTFRYEVIQIGSQPQFILYALHGYGQLVRYFIRKFSSIERSCIVVAPEGMHRFYLKGSSGRVGASWMTKEARETDISDTHYFLNKIRFEQQKKHPKIPEIVLGFSQGGATAARWNQLQGDFHACILWGCVFPPDIDKKEIHLNGKGNDYFVIGEKDEYFDATAQRKIQDFYRSINYKTISFNGNHDIDTVTLNAVLNQIKL